MKMWPVKAFNGIKKPGSEATPHFSVLKNFSFGKYVFKMAYFFFAIAAPVINPTLKPPQPQNPARAELFSVTATPASAHMAAPAAK